MTDLVKKRLNILVFIFLAFLVFIAYKELFNYYFEADEWFVFTKYFPILKSSNALLTAIISPILNNGAISAGEHVTPVESAIFYLNTKFFGLNYFPYAFMALFLHSLNSFLVFLLIKTLFFKRPNSSIFAILGGIFFALASTPMHTVTGAAPFYGENILSVTLVLLCILAFKFMYIKKNIKYFYLSLFFLFLALFSKETSGYLFLLLPFLALIEKRIFPLKFLGKVFALCVIVYILIRFIAPNASTFKDKLVNKLVGGQTYSIQETKIVDTGTIVSRDLSIYKNLPAEVASRAIIFPIRMLGTVFVPRPTVFSIVGFITPIAYPSPTAGDPGQLSFLYGSGNFVVIYFIAINILIFCIKKILEFRRRKAFVEFQVLITGLAIIFFSTIPLVLIIFTFPRWGYDFYFDSRYYYHPTVGAAILFPFLLFGIGRFFSRSFKIKSVSLAVSVVFLIWLVNNIYIFGQTKEQFINRFGADRREIISQLKSYLPVLPQKTVFYFKTDGKSAFGPALPFYTSIPQAFAVAYYDKSPLLDDFLIKPLFNSKPEGYLYTQGRGLGYYTSKKSLAEALSSNRFSVDDIYGFYYYGESAKLKNITSQVRNEMRDYLKKSDINSWKTFTDSLSKIKFLYPLSTNIDEVKSHDPNIIESFLIADPRFNADISIVNVPPTFDIHETIKFLSQKNVIEKNVYFDKYNFNTATVVDDRNSVYFMRLGDLFLYVKTQSTSREGLDIVERILGSLEIVK